MIPTAKLYATEEEVQNAWAEWSKYRICVRCNATYNLLESFGSWQCRQHLCRPTRRLENHEQVYRFWDCCLKKPYTITYNKHESVWRNFRNTKSLAQAAEVEGCIPCDHTESVLIIDDGIRMNRPISELAPLGGFKINDTVMHKGNRYTINQIYYDNSVYLEDVGKVPAKSLIWPDHVVSKNEFCNWNTMEESLPVKILAKRGNKVDLSVQNHGVAVHDIAAMIPHMTGDPTKRPGWNFEKIDGKTPFPYIKQAASSFRTKSKLFS